VERARELARSKSALNQSATLVLRAPAGNRFEGKRMWDVMLCLGLQWGDMDLFHWINRSGQGDDAFFSVSTSTSPGYFLPEAIAADQVRLAIWFLNSHPAHAGADARVPCHDPGPYSMLTRGSAAPITDKVRARCRP